MELPALVMPRGRTVLPLLCSPGARPQATSCREWVKREKSPTSAMIVAATIGPNLRYSWMITRAAFAARARLLNSGIPDERMRSGNQDCLRGSG
jgi:hypothetical protein